MFIVDMNRDIILKLGIALSILVPHSIESKLNNVPDTSNSRNRSSHVTGESPVFYQGVEGTPGVDFPIFSNIPRTVFSCKGLESGYYADLDTDCQVFHICEEEKKISFLCPNGTIFQQSDLICEWWFKVDCANSPNLFEESVEHLRNEEPKRKSFRRVNKPVDHGAVMRTEEVSSISVKRMGETYNVIRSQEDSTRKKSHSHNHGHASIHSKNRRFNDDQTGNYLNNLNENINSRSVKSNSRDIPKTTKIPHAKEYYVQFPLSSTGTDSTTYAYDNQNHFKNDDTSEIKSNGESFNIGKKYDSDETQITQESSSFARNSLNSIRDDKVRFSTTNPYPNHRTTYSDLKTPNLSSSKAFNIISSVTPQYITTQPLNNGKPFLGSRVGDNITTKDSIATLPIIVDSNKNESNYASGTSQNYEDASKHSDLIKISVGRNNANVPVGRETANSDLVDHSASATDSSKTESATDNLTFESTTNSLLSVPLSTVVIQTGNSEENFKKPVFSESFQFLPTLHTPYENKNVEFEAVSTQMSPQRYHSMTQKLSNKQLTRSGSNKSTTNNDNGKQPLEHFDSPNFESTTKTFDYATVYGSFKKTYPTKPTPSKFGNAIQIKFDDNANKVGVHLTKFVTGAGSKLVLENAGSVDPHYSNPNYNNLVNSSPSSVPLRNESTNEFDKDQSRDTNNNSVLNTEKLKSSSQTTFKIVDSPKHVSVTRSSVKTDLKTRSSNFRNIDSITTPSYSEPHTTAHPILYVLLRNSTQKPQPFGQSQQSPSLVSVEPTVLHSYKISTASPFKPAITLEPTLPTPFNTAKPVIPESVDNMMNILMEIYKVERDYPSGTPRPGLVIPPSVGPQTLHTLAVYFENALDQIVSNKRVSPHNTDDEVNKEKLTHLLTEMTRYGYGQLFRDELKTEQLTTEQSSTIVDENENSDLGEQSSNNLVQSSKIRELAKNFTSALSSFLNDPDMFRRDLEDLRPTEPPLKVQEESKAENENIRIADEELLNFSDSDSKLSLPAVFSTSSPPSPTWSFILATRATNEIDIDNNSLNPDLNTADTQSFIPSFNSLNVDNDYIPSTIPHNHWTTSPSATKLWRNTFSINPAIVNDNLDTTVTMSASDDSESTEEYPLLENSQGDEDTSREIRYELRTLPKLKLNSTEVHGLLVGFMNTTNKDSNILYNILTKLNITEDAFLSKMREIESNPLTRRLILLLISECGKEATRNTDFDSDSRSPMQPLIHDNPIQQLVDPTLTKDNEDTRALQLLNALYSIASKFSK